ncbi:glycosyltransferase family 39 protein [Vallicoccus soli]|uniref:Uncharacterized protein n=1 Tax=Vallicoccus soli TaxID=2339232 RepID=A0A3A3Z1D5_9ACTN|nr:glycosyltransferase family 39 protein [Vallicoccus soli]RJK98059.1 hypothetical protein D5H78_03735 [Vallicoccus soli]
MGDLRAALRSPWLPPVALVLVLVLPGIGERALWQDELATRSAVDRSLPDLVLLASHRDGVVAAYYALVQAWSWVAGLSPAALRLPSALGVAAAAGLTAQVGARLAGRRAGLLAGLVLAVLPAVAQYGQEARAYGLTMAAGALATLLLLRLLERASRGRALAYAASVLVLGCLQLTALLLLAGHAALVLAARRGATAEPPARRAWAAATGSALLLLLPLAYVGSRQSGVVGGLEPPGWQDVADLPAGLFGASTVGGAVLVLAALSALRRDVRGPALLAAAALPPLLLLLLSQVTPLWRDRYALVTLPAWALLVGAALARAGRREGALALAALALLALPDQVDLRGPVRSGQPDFPALAAVLAERVREGDAVVVPTARGARMRQGLQAYLPPGAWPEDVLVREGAVEAGELDAVECDPATCFPDPLPPRVWAGCRRDCRDPLAALEPETARLLRGAYEVERTWRAGAGAVSLLVLR